MCGIPGKIRKYRNAYIHRQLGQRYPCQHLSNLIHSISLEEKCIILISYRNKICSVGTWPEVRIIYPKLIYDEVRRLMLERLNMNKHYIACRKIESLLVWLFLKIEWPTKENNFNVTIYRHQINNIASKQDLIWTTHIKKKKNKNMRIQVQNRTLIFSHTSIGRQNRNYGRSA